MTPCGARWSRRSCHLMREVISDHQRSSAIISGHQRSSPAGRARVTARGASREVGREPSRPNEPSCTCGDTGRRGERLHAWQGGWKGAIPSERAFVYLPQTCSIRVAVGQHQAQSCAIRRGLFAIRLNQAQSDAGSSQSGAIRRNPTRARRNQPSLHVERLARLHTACTSAPLPSVRR
jgi:hypothetical protein